MAKQNQDSSKSSNGVGNNTTTNLSNQFLNALTQQEIAQLIDALLKVLSPDLQEQAIALLPSDTQQTVRQILASPHIHQSSQAPEIPTVSLAKQAQTWSKLWGDWGAIVWEASQEEGKYIIREADWEMPYFDTTTFAEDLEGVAKKMLPLLQTAFEHEFTPEGDFVAALLEAEAEVAAGIPDWMAITDELFIDRQLTQCMLQWEWLAVQEQGQDAFEFAQRIRQYEQEFQEINLDCDAILDFLTELSEADQRIILTGLTANKETALWRGLLDNTHSHWHQLYLYFVGQYAPDRYLEKLRETIPQQWRNGLPVIEALLTEKNYTKSLVVIRETLQALLKSERSDPAWTPEAALLVATTESHYYPGEPEDANTLLRYYQQTAQALDQTELANALAIQQLAIAQWFNWSSMFAAFADNPVSESTREALFTSWRDYVDRRSKPQTWNGYGTTKTVDSWWVLWLIDSIADAQKGANWFQQQITQWIANLPGDKTQLGENYDLLRLLTKDLTEIHHQGQSSYPQFYQVVIRPTELSTHNDHQHDRSRRDYLKLFAPVDLLTQVMNYWQDRLQCFVPRPESAEKSDYTQHARWMAALRELSPQDYETLLAQWQVVHQRRSNLWKAMKQIGLS